jgi:CheY-like chemotaxis protein
VDDNATNRALVSSFAKGWGLRALSVDSGLSALTELRNAQQIQDPYSLVILDEQMPEMDGFQVAESIQSDSRLNTGVIMMLTSADLNGASGKCRELGIHCYVVKPIGKADLKFAIERCLGKSNPIDIPRPQSEPLRSSATPKSLQVLLAEDNLINQKVALRLLEKRGHRVIVANTGREAVSLFEEGGIDVILMDVQMPEMDGFEATAEIRRIKDGRHQSVPIVAMTANAMTGDRERCMEAGMNNYIAKPIDARELIRLVEELGGRASEN